MNLKSIVNKLYISLIYLVTTIVLFAFIINAAIVIHDYALYSKLPYDYKVAIVKLQNGSNYWELTNEQIKAIRTLTEKWIKIGKLPFYVAGEIVEEPGPWLKYRNFDSNRDEILGNYLKCVRYWGFYYQHEHPWYTLLFSVGFFLPPIVLILLRKWALWIFK